MSRNTSRISVLIVISLLIGEFFIVKNYYSKPIIIDDIELVELSHKKDSIRVIVDTVEKRIINNRHYYEKIIDTIMVQSDSLDDEFTRQYLCEFLKERGLTMCRPSKTN